MKQYEDLVTLLKKVQTTGGLDCDQASVCDYQDMIGHSTQEQLKDLSNGVYISTFYRVYGLAYGTTEAIKFYMQNSDKVYNILLERDNAVIDRDEALEKLENQKQKIADNFLKAQNAMDAAEEEKAARLKAEENLEKAQAEIIELKAKLYDLITK